MGWGGEEEEITIVQPSHSHDPAVINPAGTGRAPPAADRGVIRPRVTSVQPSTSAATSTFPVLVADAKGHNSACGQERRCVL